MSPIFSLAGGKYLWETMAARGQNDNNIICALDKSFARRNLCGEHNLQGFDEIQIK